MVDDKSNKILEKIDSIQNVINTISLGLLVFLVIAQIILRYVLKLPLLGIEELMMYPIIWLFMIGGASASLRDEHIECGMLESFVTNPKVLSIFNIVKYFCSSAISSVITIYTFQMAKYSLKMWKTSGTLYIPMFYAEVALFVGMLLMFAYSLFHLWRVIKTTRDGRDSN
ncbi:TRAP transporter small permease [Tissierella sp. Yu-01]|uniref:TRAP transporter small permease n=1 Tax=Tissierella sp. Yu-01 TaxID=3035694 RepID=UPI00240DCD63|nr:TRAP transporter small permease [Tissierella sp. Yu-01]WFA08578.1 TRAP transporter small permease [Tissierella sp. Yu-01]